MNKKERIEDAIALLITACGRTEAERHLSIEDQVMSAAAYAAGFITTDSEVTLALDHSTEWLQARFEIGRSEGLQK